MTTRSWIGLGANLGAPAVQIAEALAAIDADARVHGLVRSRLMRTAPVGGPSGQPDYWNGVARCEFDGSARELLRLLQWLEQRAGRVRVEPNGPRPLDLDLLVYGEHRIHEPDLVVPHPRMLERRFVLEPLSELDPDLRVPGTDRAVSAALAALRP